MNFDFSQSVAYNNRKAAWHVQARKQLKLLAKALQLTDYDLRSNQGGIAVSGEVTLHSDTIYVQAMQSCIGDGMGILYRTCKGKKDYTGGPNNWVPLALLNDIPELARKVGRLL